MSAAFSPLPANRFDVYAAAHLIWRSGFGAPWEQVEAMQKLGMKTAVESLTAYKSGEDSGAPKSAKLPAETDKAFEERVKKLTEPERQKARELRGREEREKIGELRYWWLNRMLTTPRPLEEKMTLFWHSHFATGFNDKIERAFPLWQQNELFRQNALAPFDELTKKVVRDPAMLVWLDNANNEKGRPNENFGRELMELFTLGVGNYTEVDVKQAARALTGYHVNREQWSFVLNNGAHDTDEKTLLGKTGKWNAEDAVRIICEQPACGRFIAGKLLSFFVYENPEPELLEEAAALFRAQGMNVGKFLAILFQSELFYSPKARNSIVKSPVLLTIGALKSLRFAVPEREVLIDALRLMGQDLFFPPEVNGWVGGMSWINSNMLLIRYNFANFLLNGVSPDQFKTFKKETAGSASKRRDFVEAQRTGKPIEWSPKQQLKDLGLDRRLATGADIVDYYIRQFLARPLPRELRQQFVNFAETDASGGRKSFALTDTNFDERVRGLVHLMMSSPDYQLC